MKLNYKPALVWMTVYVVTIIAFSFIYFMIWQNSPDSFLINEQINLGPIRGFQALLQEDVTNPTTLDLSKIEGLRVAYANSIANLSKISTNLEANLKATETLLGKLSKEHTRIMMDNYQKSVDSATSNLVEQRVKLAKDVEIYNDLIKNAVDDTKTYLSLAQSKKQVELAQLDYVIATKKVKAMQKGLSELGSFADAGLAISVATTNSKAIELSKSIIDIKSKKEELKNNISDEVHKLVTARSSRLKWRDFLYFSVITATTVGYGDIIPNSDAVRLAVMIEILLCIVVFGLLISLVTQTKS